MHTDLPSEVAGPSELATLMRRSDGYTEKGCAEKECSRRTIGDSARHPLFNVYYYSKCDSKAALTGGAPNQIVILAFTMETSARNAQYEAYCRPAPDCPACQYRPGSIP